MKISNQNDEDEKSTGTRKLTLKEKLVNKICDVYFELIRDRNTSTYFGTSMIVLATMQMIGYLYYRGHDTSFDDTLSSGIAGVLDTLRIYPVIESNHWASAYFALALVMDGLLMAHVGLTIYVEYWLSSASPDRKRLQASLMLKLLRMTNTLLFWAFAAPFTETMISVFKCEGGKHIVVEWMTCWEGLHLACCFVSAFYLLLFIIAIVLTAILYNETRSNCSDAFSRRDSNAELTLLAHRFVLGCQIVMEETAFKQWSKAGFQLLGSYYLVSGYFQGLSYYNPVMSVVFGGCMLAYFWSSLNVVIMMALGYSEFAGLSAIILVGSALAFPLARLWRNKLLYRLQMSKHQKLSSEAEADLLVWRILSLLYSQQRLPPAEQMVLSGFVGGHARECRNPACPLKDRDVDLSSAAPKAVLPVLAEMYSEYAGRTKSGANIHIEYSQFLFAYIANSHLALVELNSAAKDEPTFQQRMSIYRCKRFIEDSLVENYTTKKEKSSQMYERLDPSLVITFEKVLEKLQKAMETSANEHIEFWGHLDSIMPDLNSLQDIGLNIIQYSFQTQAIWAQLVKINPSYYKALKNYGYYLSEILNDEEEGHELVERAKGIEMATAMEERMSDFEIMFADDTAIVSISADKGSLCKITNTNAGIRNVFAYNRMEILGQDVSVLMPPMFASKHRFFIEEFVRTGKEMIINKELELFALPRSGHAISVYTIVKPLPSLLEGIQYIGLMRQRHRNYEFIVTDSEGRIDAASSWVSGLFHLQPNFLKEHQVYVHLLCPDLLDLAAAPDGSSCTQFDLLKGTYELTFLLPLDFPNLVNSMTKNACMGSEEWKKSEEPLNKEPSEDLTPRAAGKASVDSWEDTSLIDIPEGGLVMGRRRRRRKTPEIVKKICYLLAGDCSQETLRASKNVIRDHVDYAHYECKKTWRVEVSDQSFANGAIKIKVFKFLRDKSAAEVAEEKDSSENGEEVKSYTESPSLAKDDKDLTAPPSVNRKLSKEMAAALKGHKKRMSSFFPQRSPGMKAGSTELPSKDPKLPKPEQKFTATSGNLGKAVISGALGSSMVPDADSASQLRHANSSNLEMVREAPERVTGEMSAKVIDSADPPLTLDASAISDLNASRLDERPLMASDTKVKLITEFSGSRVSLEQDAKAPQAQNTPVHRDHFLRKGFPAGPDDSAQEQFIQNCLAAPAPDGKTPDGASQFSANPEAKAPPKPIQDDDTGSVASTSDKLFKQIKELRKAAYEEYSPKSIFQLQVAARVVFLVLLAVTITYFLITRNVYERLQKDVENIMLSKDRLVSIAGIGTATRSLLLLNPYANADNVSILNLTVRNSTDYYKDGYYTIASANVSMNYTEWVYTNLDKYIVLLKNSQNALSANQNSITRSALDQVNPSAIPMVYNVRGTNKTTVFNADCWTAVMGLVTHAMTVRSLPLSSVVTDEPSTFYVIQNVFNAFAGYLLHATDAIFFDSNNKAEDSRQLLMILLIVTWAVIFVSGAIIIRVAVQSNQSKAEILNLFTEVPTATVKHQLKRCRACFNAFYGEDGRGKAVEDLPSEPEAEEDEKAKTKEKEKGKEEKEEEEKKQKSDEEGEEKEKKDSERSDEENEASEPLNTEKQRAHRKGKKTFKPYSGRPLLLVLSIAFVMSLLGSYFCLTYFKSKAYLDRMLAMIEELDYVACRWYNSVLMYGGTQEYFGSNGTATLGYVPSQMVMLYYSVQSARDQESYLLFHTSHERFYNPDYNTLFYSIMYKNLCEYLGFDSPMVTECTKNQAMIYGLRPASIDFWDKLAAGMKRFISAGVGRTLTLMRAVFSDPDIIAYERLQSRYVVLAYDTLSYKIYSCMIQNKDSEETFLVALLGCYLGLLVVLFVFAWSKFVEFTRHSLWVTKSMIGILPVSVIHDVRSIKEFLISTSKSAFHF